MIRRVSRKKLDVQKYDACIAESVQSNVFGFSWYLDIACDKWEVFVRNDYEAVMPFPKRKKFFITYVYEPFWMLQLGVYSRDIEEENEFLIALLDEFKFVEYKVNPHNHFSLFTNLKIQKTVQVCDLQHDYSVIFNKYRKDRKRDLKKAQKKQLIERWNDHPEHLIELFQKNVGKKVKKIKKKDYEKLLQLIHVCKQKGVGEVLSIYEEEKLVSSAFILTYNQEAILLVSVTDVKKRKNGGNAFLIDRAIYKYHKHYKRFNFGGSSMKKIRAYFLSFGAKDVNYYFIKQNNWSKFIRFFKP